MTTYGKSIDQTEDSAHGCKFSATVGTGGVTAGQTVKWSGETVVACSANTDLCCGIARDTVSSGTSVTVLGDNCRVKTGQTLTAAARVEPSSAGTTQDYTSGTIIGTCIDSETSASILRVKVSY